MKNTRKLICAILAAALLILSVAPAYAAVEVNWGSGKIYLGSSNDTDTNGTSIQISGLKSDSKITTIKTSDKKTISLGSLDYWNYRWKSLDGNEGNEDYEASIYIYAQKKGKATISFKVDGKSYSKSFEVLGYENPIKSLVLTGVSKANLKSKFANRSYAWTKLSKDAKAGDIKLSATNGWKITSIGWNAYNGDNGYRSFDFESGVSSAKMPIPKMKKKASYNISMTFVNTKTKTIANCNFHLNDE